MKKYLRFLTSLKFGIILFIIIALYSVIGTVLPQGMAEEIYLQHYPKFGNLIVALDFNNVYSSIIFRVIIVFFIINLAGCTFNILPGQLLRMKESFFPSIPKDNENLWNSETDIDKFKESLKKNRFTISDKEESSYASKHRFGYIGPSVTHLGIIVIILGGFIGNVFAMEGSFNLIPSETKTFEEEGFSIVLDDFYLDFREDNTTEQYYSEVTIFEDDTKVKEEKIWVNKPLLYKGINFYQSNFGWTNKLLIRNTNDSILYEGQIKDGQNYFDDPHNLFIYLHGFYPDFTMTQMGEPVTKSQKIVNPYYAVALYEHDQYIDSYIIEPGQRITYNDITIEFDEPTLYTGITYRKDFGYYFILLGSLILILGLIISFHFYPKYVFVSSDKILPITKQNSWGYN
ncbi:MAG: cytochrome c biogenesis protein ResB, partial [Clostridium sp.]|nr:cytochrome c biogenesis protein ResB [Clostridium sp.]